ncbi:outer membrane lipoprotein-sorting protein [Biformimicrobium ophioploci]|uniref:Outer membrane lipoprotein-sorting protein n=1 Tax=Biformimicrobium ophioploci TaxID=3036711 RepID=A0ABQ6LZP7_9GAMM|nr:outer membrane lipoprotein-sorting protein [Microbulbifer sp. NKW57]GMG87548.1 outer membrane lipoprotein-sorting protein [Microbulbifer sp. NKW57]
MNNLIGVIGALLLATAAQTQASAQMSVEEIVSKANQASLYAGESGKAEARMIIVDAAGRKQMRQFSLLRRNTGGGDQDYLVHFSRPADVRNTVFRVAKHIESDDDRWLYLPALDLVKRISAGDKRTSFVGSHFFYEDVSGRNLNEDNFSLLEETETHFLIEGKPKSPGSVEFVGYTASISKQTFLPETVEYVDGAGDTYRRVSVVETQVIDGFPTVVKSRVEDLKNGGYTLLQFRNVGYGLALDDGVFSERSLRRPPLELFKN